MATIIREAIELHVPDGDTARREGVARVLASAGRFDSGLADISERHDEHLADDPRGW